MSLTPVHDHSVLRNASTAQLEQAVADNHRQLFCLNALALGGDVHITDELTYTYTPANGAAVALPSLTEANASAQLDVMMDFYRARQADNIGYWSLDPPSPPYIGASLLARGFQPGWQPCWMALDVNKIQTGYPAPSTLEIKTDNGIPIHGVQGLPYGDNGGALSDALFRTYPERVQRFVAFLDGAIVGQCCLFFTTGTQGIAGMYNVGVIPPAQRQGIGKALVIAACHFARERGYQYVMLNANHIGRRTYEQTGFQFISYGCTWWLMGKRYITHPTAQKMVLLAEAAGKGDLASMEKMRSSFTAEELNTPLSNGMTLVQLAAHARQPAAAEWLIQQGALCTALDAWDLGWKDRVATMLATDAQEVNRRYFDWQGTLLHVAAQRGDTALAQLALKANADLSIKDKEYDGIPLGWAYHFQRLAIITLIKEYMDKK